MEFLRTTPRRTLAIATAILITVFELIAVLDVTGNEDDDTDWVGWIVISVVASLIAAAMLLRFVPATESEPDDDNKPAKRALVVAIVALITVAVFWTALPFAFGVPALVLAAEGRARSATYGRYAEATAAAVIAGFAIIATMVLDIVG
jgi:hypothetical protein